MPSVDVATDLLMGAKVEAILRIISGEVGLDYIRDIAGMVLAAFGVSPDEATTRVRAAYDRIVTLGPAQLDWWREDFGAGKDAGSPNPMTKR